MLLLSKTKYGKPYPSGHDAALDRRDSIRDGYTFTRKKEQPGDRNTEGRETPTSARDDVAQEVPDVSQKRLLAM